MKVILTLAFIVLQVVSQKLPDNFKICEHFGPNLNECLKGAIQSALNQLRNGIPEINVPSIEPFKTPNVTIQGNQHVVSFTDIYIYNTSTGIVKEVDAHITRERFEAKILVETSQLVSELHYSLKGKVLLFTVDGGGNAVITFKNNTLTANMLGHVVNGQGEHFELSNLTITMNPKLITCYLENIVPGQKQINEEFNKVLNENWDVLFKEVKPTLEEFFGNIFMEFANYIFKYVPV